MNDLELLATLVVAARGLASDDGTNVEYDRALIQLIGAVVGADQDQLPAIAALIGSNR